MLLNGNERSRKYPQKKQLFHRSSWTNETKNKDKGDENQTRWKTRRQQTSKDRQEKNSRQKTASYRTFQQLFLNYIHCISKNRGNDYKKRQNTNTRRCQRKDLVLSLWLSPFIFVVIVVFCVCVCVWYCLVFHHLAWPSSCSIFDHTFVQTSYRYKTYVR